jgi:uncharacterized protein YneF (UPF0154 family)
MDTVGAELVSFFQALKNGSLLGYFILMVLVLIGLALVIGAFVYKRIVTKRLRAASKATQENLETMAVLRKRALEVKERDDDLWKRDLEVEERELKGLVKDTNTELRPELERPQQQRQVLKRSQRALRATVSQIITVGLKDIQNRSKQISRG